MKREDVHIPGGQEVELPAEPPSTYQVVTSEPPFCTAGLGITSELS